MNDTLQASTESEHHTPGQFNEEQTSACVTDGSRHRVQVSIQAKEKQPQHGRQF